MNRPKRKVALVVVEQGAGWTYEPGFRREHDDLVVVVQGPGESSDAFGERVAEKLDQMAAKGSEPCHAVLSLQRGTELGGRLALSSMLARAMSRGPGGTLELRGADAERAQIAALADTLSMRVDRGVTVRARATGAAPAVAA